MESSLRGETYISEEQLSYLLARGPVDAVVCYEKTRGEEILNAERLMLLSSTWNRLIELY